MRQTVFRLTVLIDDVLHLERVEDEFDEINTVFKQVSSHHPF
jgi:hypothetical protein